MICYGVLNAKAVRIEPRVEGVSPSLNRCVEVSAEKETRYTLTAEGADGRTVSESFVLGVRADQETLPKITSFSVMKRERDYTGKWIFSLAFAAQNPGRGEHRSARVPDAAPLADGVVLRGAGEDHDVHADGHGQVRAQGNAVADGPSAAGVARQWVIE